MVFIVLVLPFACFHNLSNTNTVGLFVCMVIIATSGQEAATEITPGGWTLVASGGGQG